MNKNLIVYFSKDGENYVSGEIKELDEGNTQKAAKKIAELTGADLFKLEPVQAYPDNYKACVTRAKDEFKQKARPELKEKIDLSQYDNIILGFPIWIGTVPMPVLSFIESNDLSGKTILPFCTNEGSGFGFSLDDLEKSLKDSQLKEGLALIGSQVEKSDRRIEKWLQENLD